MSEKVTIIEPQYIRDFIEWLAMDAYYEYGGKGSEKPLAKMNRKEQEAFRKMVKIVAKAISKGLILAKRQPELADALIQYLNAMRPGYPAELLTGMLADYEMMRKGDIYFKLMEKGNEMSEQKMKNLRAQGYSIKQIAEMLGMDKDFVQEVIGEEWGQFDFRALIGKKVLVKEKLKEPRTGRVSIGTATVVVKGISPSGDRVLLEYPKAAGMTQWSEAKNLKIIRELGNEKEGQNTNY